MDDSEAPRRPTAGAPRNLEERGATVSELLLPRNEEGSGTLHQQVQRMPAEQASNTRTLRTHQVCKGRGIPMAGHHYGLHHEATAIGRHQHWC